MQTILPPVTLARDSMKRSPHIAHRTDALIRISHPNFRDWLRAEVERLAIVPRLVVPGVTLP